MRYQIYILVDPRTSNVKYVGWSQDAESRYRWHLTAAIDRIENNHKACWIRSLIREGLFPELRVVEEGSGNWAAAERWWIKFYREEVGMQLTNMTDGGEGMSGFSFAPGSRKKMSDAARLRWSRHKYKIVESQNHGRSRMTEDQRLMSNDKKSLKQRGRVFTDDHRRKLSVALIGNRNHELRGTDGKFISKVQKEKFDAS